MRRRSSSSAASCSMKPSRLRLDRAGLDRDQHSRRVRRRRRHRRHLPPGGDRRRPGLHGGARGARSSWRWPPRPAGGGGIGAIADGGSERTATGWTGTSSASSTRPRRPGRSPMPARTLNMSQSAVSRQVSALEQDLGVPLFHRHARGLILTEQGERPVPHRQRRAGQARRRSRSRLTESAREADAARCASPPPSASARPG